MKTKYKVAAGLGLLGLLGLGAYALSSKDSGSDFTITPGDGTNGDGGGGGGNEPGGWTPMPGGPPDLPTFNIPVTTYNNVPEYTVTEYNTSNVNQFNPNPNLLM